MKARSVVALAAALSLIMPAIYLSLYFANINFFAIHLDPLLIFWPSSVFLMATVDTSARDTTLIVFISIAVNTLLYTSIGLIIWYVCRFFRGKIQGRGS